LFTQDHQKEGAGKERLGGTLGKVMGGNHKAQDKNSTLGVLGGLGGGGKGNILERKRHHIKKVHRVRKV